MHIDQSSIQYYEKYLKDRERPPSGNFSSVQLVTQFFENIPKSLSVISVGCGVGSIEYFLSQNGYSIYGIDPEPESFKKYTSDSGHIRPVCDTVPNFIKKYPEMVGKCSLMLIWPSPGDSFYDLESIKLLKPLFIYIFYDKLGGAGGAALHRWLKYTPKYYLTSEITKKCVCSQQFGVSVNLAITTLARVTPKICSEPKISVDDCQACHEQAVDPK